MVRWATCGEGALETMTEPAMFKYRAFLSYSHADTKRAKWLHSRLESFPIDKELVGRVTAAGPIPKSLRPVLRSIPNIPQPCDTPDKHVDSPYSSCRLKVPFL